MNKQAIAVSRVLVGLLFIFSGLIKANDPLGLSYKMQEFFEVWHLNGLDNYTLAFSVIMIVFEIVAGVAVLLGWQMHLFSWLLLVLILFFSFLTGYAVLSGKIKECGCFGNCIPLQAMGSFIKDLILLTLILFLFVNRKRIHGFLSSGSSLLILLFTTIFSFSFQWYTLHYLPVMDCLPYKAGVSIPGQMKPPAGAIPDSTVITFVYEKNHKAVEYTADKLPPDLDSSYTFVKRYDKMIRKGNAEPAIKDFSLISASGNDTTQQVLNREGYKLFVFSRAFPESNPSWNKSFSVIYSLVKSKHIPVYFITSATDEAADYLKKNGLDAEIPVFGCDATAIKTAARADPTLYLLKQGTILNKWGYSDFETSIEVMNQLPVQNPVH